LISIASYLFKLAFVLCALSVLCYLLSLLIKKVMLAKIATWILVLTLLLLTGNLLPVVLNPSSLMNIASRDFFTFCAWCIAAAYLAFQFKTKTRILGAFVSPIILLLLIIAAGTVADKSLVPNDLRSWLTFAHLIPTIGGEAFFVIASCAGAMFLMQNSSLKHKKLSALGRLLPSLHDLDRINYHGLLWGFLLLTLGIFAGTAFAVSAWDRGWTMDPKIIWTFAVWVIYGFLLHQRLAIGWRGARMAFLSCAFFIIFLFSYLAVKICFETVHNFI
jgi:ABC-type transport system involved in cytochrome c biogenesis permease subunit